MEKAVPHIRNRFVVSGIVGAVANKPIAGAGPLQAHSKYGNHSVSPPDCESWQDRMRSQCAERGILRERRWGTR